MNATRPLTLTAVGWGVWGALVLFVLLGTEDRDAWLLRQGPGSTAAAGPRGLSRLYRALRQIEVPVGRLREGGVLPANTTLVVVDPPPPGSEMLSGVDDGVLASSRLSVVIAGDREQILRACPALGGGGVPDTTLGAEGEVIVDLVYEPKRVGIAGGTIAFTGTPDGDTVLVQTESGKPIVLQRALGAGRVIYCSDPRLFANEGIDVKDNARLVLALCASRGSVTFDDRWVTVASAEAGHADMMSILYGTTIGRAIVTLVLTGGLVLFLRGIRVGGPAARLAGRRPASGYVNALAEAMLAARKGGQALRHFQDSLRRDAAKRLGLPPDCKPETLAPLLAARCGEDPDTIVRLLSDRQADARVAETTRRLDALRRRGL